MRKINQRREFIKTAALTIGALALNNSSFAQSWPSRPVKMVVPYAAGNQADIVARLIAEELSKKWGQSLIIENVAGAGGAIGVAQIARAKPDGYTIGLAAIAALAIVPHIEKTPYDPLTDLTTIAGVTIVNGSVLVINPSHPVKNMQEFVAYAKSRSNKPLSFYTSGIGTIPHLNTEILAKSLNIPLLHIPYKAATAGITDLISGEIDLGFDSLSVLEPFVKAGKVRAIAVATDGRSKSLADVPNFKEFSEKIDLKNAWQSIQGPKGMPADIANRIEADIFSILSRPDFTSKFPPGTIALNIKGASAAERIRAEYFSFGEIVKQLGLKAS